jgi:hypothetical protein
LAEVGLVATPPLARVGESVGGSGERRFLPPRNLTADADGEEGVRQADTAPTPLSTGIRSATAQSIQIVPFLAQLLAQEGAGLDAPGSEADPVSLRDGLLAYRIAKGIGLNAEADAPDDDTIITRGPTTINFTL